MPIDGNTSIETVDTGVGSSDEQNDDSEYDTEDEVDPEPIPANFFQPDNQTLVPGQPIQLDVVTNDKPQNPPRLPLCLMFNARSIYNKVNRLRTMLNQIGPDITIISETWERRRQSIDELLSLSQFKSVSYCRQKVSKNKAPGGGSAIIYNDNRFEVTEFGICVPENVEATWAVFRPLSNNLVRHKVNRILVGAIYVSPRSRNKIETIDHVIDAIHTARAQFGNDVNFLIGGDFNRLDVSPILDCYGALKQIVSIPTRKDATLELLLADLHPFYHPPTTMPPLQVDDDKVGSDSDHDVVLMAPSESTEYAADRTRKTVFTRPMPESSIHGFGQEITSHQWEEVFLVDNVDDKAFNFHFYIQYLLNKYFPQKSVKVSILDKQWMSPELKLLHRKRQRAFVKNRNGEKWRKLNKSFKKLKRKAVKSYYSNFVNELKSINPGQWYKIAKRIGALDQSKGDDIYVESLEGLSKEECAQNIAEYFASVSNEYLPVDHKQLPCYLPATKPLQVTEFQIYERLKKQKKTKSTLPVDIPDSLRIEFAAELAGPLTDVINSCLEKQTYPKLWKYEWVTPVPKITHPKVLKDLRKISCTSDYNKLFEGILKDWILEDISENIDIGQFGGQTGTGTEHMIVCLLDRVLHLLDRYNDKSAVIAASIDWAAAFDRQDPTLAIKKFIEIGVRPNLIPLLISYLDERKMKVKFNGAESETYSLIGGGPQGSLIGQIMYLVQSNDNANIVDSQDRFKYIDDLSILQIVTLAGLVKSYNFHEHVASDIGIDQVYLPASSYETQQQLDSISEWTYSNMMKLNEAKSNYMIFSRSKVDFATRLVLNNNYLEKVSVTKLLGIWISEDLSWSKNTQEICKKAYSRLSMLTKLKYVGVGIEDLINIYILFIRSCAEYCSVAFHSSLTAEHAADLERIQKTSLKVILGESYLSYNAALEMTGLVSLYDRREKRCLDFSLKCLKHPINSRLFPMNPNYLNPAHKGRNRERFVVNFASTDTYKDSAIPYCQRLLNQHFSAKS